MMCVPLEDCSVTQRACALYGCNVQSMPKNLGGDEQGQDELEEWMGHGSAYSAGLSEGRLVGASSAQQASLAAAMALGVCPCPGQTLARTRQCPLHMWQRPVSVQHTSAHPWAP